MRKISLITFLFTLARLITFAQTGPADYLKSLESANTSKDSLTAISDLANWYLYENVDSASLFLEELKTLAQRENNAVELINYYRFQGIYLADQLGESLAGRKMFFKSLQIADSTNSRIGRELAYTELGYNYRVTGQLDSSNLYFTKTLQVLEKGDSIGRASVLNGIGLNYKTVGATEEAASAFFEVLQLVEGNFGYETVIYYNLRLLYEGQDEFEEAEKYGQLALKAAQNGGNKFSVANAEQALGGILLKVEKYDSAKTHLINAIALANDLGAATILINAKTTLASLKINQSHWSQALSLIEEIKQLLPADRVFTNFSLINLEVEYQLEKPNPSPSEALAIVSRMEQSLNESKLKELKSDLYKLKSKIYAFIDPKLALDFYIKHDSIEKHLNSEKLKQYSKLLQTQYETEKKDQEITSLTQKATINALQLTRRNNQLLIGGLAGLVLLVGGFLFYQNDRNKKAKVASELEQRFLRSQLNPHFIFNSMTAIQNFLIAKKNVDEASHYMGMFSSLMRQILENSRQEFITLDEEVKMLKNYLELQKVRFNQSLTYEIHLDDSLDGQYNGVPPMFAQPFVENAIEHGLFKDSEKENKITVRFNHINDELIGIEIEDSGTGIAENKASDHHSLATKITQERLHSLETTYKKDFRMKAKNSVSKEGKISGFMVHLTLPSKIILST